jgi:hypothetical protein
MDVDNEIQKMEQAVAEDAAKEKELEAVVAIEVPAADVELIEKTVRVGPQSHTIKGTAAEVAQALRERES